VRPKKKDRSASKDTSKPIKKKDFKEDKPGRNPSLFSQTELDQLMQTLAILTKKNIQSCNNEEVRDEQRDRRDRDDRSRGRGNRVNWGSRGNMRE